MAVVWRMGEGEWDGDCEEDGETRRDENNGVGIWHGVTGAEMGWDD